MFHCIYIQKIIPKSWEHQMQNYRQSAWLTCRVRSGIRVTTPDTIEETAK